MENYKEPYFILFRHTERALRQLEACQYDAAKEQLIAGQQQAEEAFLIETEDSGEDS